MKTKTCIFAVLLAVGLSNSRAQDTWTQKANVGGEARWAATRFSIGSKGYVGTGGQAQFGPFYKDFWEYDPATNVWTQKADFGGTARDSAVGFSIGTKGYVGTGLDTGEGGRPTKDFWEYDPGTNVWTQKADFGGVIRFDAIGLSTASKGYIGTGGDGIGNFYNDFWEYDPATNAWTRKADFGGPGRSSAVGLSIGSKGYVGALATLATTKISGSMILPRMYGHKEPTSRERDGTLRSDFPSTPKDTWERA